MYIHQLVFSLFYSDLEQLQAVSSCTGMHRLRLPLHLALAVSPCVLLLQTKLHKQEVGQLHLIEASPNLLHQ
jgi:hypothetical protein